MLHPEIPSSCGWSNSSLPLQLGKWGWWGWRTPQFFTSAMMKKGWKDQNVLEKGWKDSTFKKKMRRNWGKIVVPEWVYIAIYIYIMTLGFSLNGRYPNSHQSWWAKNKRVLLHWNWGCPFSDEPKDQNFGSIELSEGYPCNIRWSYLWSAKIASSREDH